MKNGLLSTFLFCILSLSPFSKSFVIENVMVLPMLGKESLRRRFVVIENGVIAGIDKKGRSAPEGAASIDGAGKFLILGLWDMHVHV